MSLPSTQLLRIAFLLEASLNLIGGATMIFTPSTFLSLLLPSPTTTTITNPLLSSPSPLSTSLIQWLGSLSCALAIPLLLAYPDSREAPALRKFTYWTLFAGEGFLVPVMMAQWMRGGVFSGRGLGVAIGILGGTAVARVCALLGREEWFGEVDGRKKKD